MGTKYSIIMTTCSDEESSKKIINALLNKKLAACIQVQKINSHYVWKGSINVDNELLLFIKTKHSLYREIESCIRENHSYEVPEIIEVPMIDGSESYFKWIDEVCK